MERAIPAMTASSAWKSSSYWRLAKVKVEVNIEGWGLKAEVRNGRRGLRGAIQVLDQRPLLDTGDFGAGLLGAGFSVSRPVTYL